MTQGLNMLRSCFDRDVIASGITQDELVEAYLRKGEVNREGSKMDIDAVDQFLVDSFEFR